MEAKEDVLACRRVVNTFVKGCRDFGVCLVVSVRPCFSSKVQSQLDCMSLRRLVKGRGSTCAHNCKKELLMSVGDLIAYHSFDQCYIMYRFTSSLPIEGTSQFTSDAPFQFVKFPVTKYWLLEAWMCKFLFF